MKSRRVKVFAPASISNLGPGFDVLGIALHRPGDVIIAERSRESGLNFSLDSSDPLIPSSARDNVAGYVANLMLRELRPDFGIRMILQKNMPVGSGLGSSGASCAASVAAVNALLRKPLPRSELIRFAVEGERKASGSPHADNVAPSLLGGLCLIRSYNPLDIVQLPVSPRLVWIVVHPHHTIRTEEARSVLPKMLSLSTAIQQWGNVGGLTAGLVTGDPSIIKKCIEDSVAEPAREHLIPGYRTVKEAAIRAGAVGCSISGSGPSVFALATSGDIARRVGGAMERAFQRAAGLLSDVYISRVNRQGAKIALLENR